MTKPPQTRAGIYVVVTASSAAIRNFGVRSIDSSIITEDRTKSTGNLDSLYNAKTQKWKNVK
jgi:hypothetical protein